MTARETPAPAILAFDIDGTVLGRGDLPVPGVAQALRDLADSGVSLVPATGRPLHGALKAAATLEVSPTACVAYHGALVVDLVSGQQLRHLTLPGDLAAALALDALGEGLDVSLYVGDERLDLQARWTPGSSATAGASSAGATPGVPGVTRLVLAGDPLRVMPAMPELEAVRRAGLRIEPVRPGVVVVLPAGADKGEGLRLVAAHLGVPPARVVACGDDLADITMLLAAGRAVAVGDAHPALRAVAETTVAQDRLPAVLREIVRGLG
jgi:hydroxymethylpyrimidine pyrophosphatase-like HAD family hydrolase